MSLTISRVSSLKEAWMPTTPEAQSHCAPRATEGLWVSSAPFLLQPFMLLSNKPLNQVRDGTALRLGNLFCHRLGVAGNPEIKDRFFFVCSH